MQKTSFFVVLGLFAPSCILHIYIYIDITNGNPSCPNTANRRANQMPGARVFRFNILYAISTRKFGAENTFPNFFQFFFAARRTSLFHHIRAFDNIYNLLFFIHIVKFSGENNRGTVRRCPRDLSVQDLYFLPSITTALFFSSKSNVSLHSLASLSSNSKVISSFLML